MSSHVYVDNNVYVDNEMYKDADPVQSSIKSEINRYLCDRFNECVSRENHNKWALVLDSKSTRTSNHVRS